MSNPWKILLFQQETPSGHVYLQSSFHLIAYNNIMWLTWVFTCIYTCVHVCVPWASRLPWACLFRLFVCVCAFYIILLLLCPFSFSYYPFSDGLSKYRYGGKYLTGATRNACTPKVECFCCCCCRRPNPVIIYKFTGYIYGFQLHNIKYVL